jgi:Ser/Thr protein kinase RdoA (MazF antagonist)
MPDRKIGLAGDGQARSAPGSTTRWALPCFVGRSAQGDRSVSMPSAHVPVRSSILDPDALRQMVIPAYGLPAQTTCRLISRAVNDVYQVDARSDRFFLRISPHGWRSETELEAEIALIGDLRQRQVRVAVALPRQDGRFLTALAAPEGARYTVLFARAEGDDNREITLRQAEAYGRLAAAMHLAADAAPRQYARPTLDEALLLTEPMTAIRGVITWDREDLAFMEGAAERVAHRLAELPRGAGEFGLIHGDLHPANVRFDAKGEPTLFDFDLAGYGWRAYDLIIFLWNSYGEARPRRWRESRWRAFRQGYAQVRPLPEGLEELLPYLLVARQIWLMGMDASERGGWPPQWLEGSWHETVKLVRGWCMDHPVLAG